MPAIHEYDELLSESRMEGSSDEDSNNKSFVEKKTKNQRNWFVSEDAFVKQLLILDQMESIDFD